MKILVDMNLSPLWVPFLQQHGFDAVHWSALGSPSAADGEIMDHAKAGGFVIFPTILTSGCYSPSEVAPDRA